MANPIQGGAQVIAKQSGGRKTALALVIGIAATEVILSGKGRAFWSALWGQVHPLTVVKQTPQGGVQVGPLPGGSNGPGNNNSGTTPVGPGIL